MNLKRLNSYLLNVYQLKDVIRYNCRKHIKDESVAEHSFYVALISLEICDRHHISKDVAYQCLVKALLHDMPEMDLNDITHNVKERLNLRPMLKKYEDDYYLKNYQQHSELMINGNDLVNAIVDLADAMSVYQYVLNEISLGSKSKDIIEIKTDTISRLKKQQAKLKKLLKGAKK